MFFNVIVQFKFLGFSRLLKSCKLMYWCPAHPDDANSQRTQEIVQRGVAGSIVVSNREIVRCKKGLAAALVSAFGS